MRTYQEINFYNGLKSHRSPYGPTEGSSSLNGIQGSNVPTKNQGTLDLNDSCIYHELDARYMLSTIKTSDGDPPGRTGLDAFSFRNN
jgi:hypothetical protein